MTPAARSPRPICPSPPLGESHVRARRLGPVAAAMVAMMALAGQAMAQDALGNGRALDGGLLSAPGGRFNQQVRPVGVLLSSRVGSGLPGSVSGLDQASRELSFSTSPLRQQEILRQRLADSGLYYAGPSATRSWEQAALRNAGIVPSSVGGARLPQNGLSSRPSAPIGSTLDDVPQPGEALLARPNPSLPDRSSLDPEFVRGVRQEALSPLDGPRFRASTIDGLRRLDGRDRPLPIASNSTRLDDALTQPRSQQPLNQSQISRLPAVLTLPSTSSLSLSRPGSVPLTPSQERALLQSLPRDASIPMTYSDLRELQLAPRRDAGATPSSASRSIPERATNLPDPRFAPPPTLDDLRDGSRPLSARIENREDVRDQTLQNTRVQRREDFRFTDDNAPGRATGLDPLAGPLSSESQRRLQALEQPALAAPIEPLNLRPVAGRRGMELAAQALAAGKFVSAESLFAAESWKDARDFSAVMGQVHSAAAAGILASTGLILADAYTREERLIGQPLEPALIMPESRVDEIGGRLIDEINKRRDGYAGILLAHLGYVHNRPEWIKQGLASVEESSEARLQLLAPKLRAGWLK